MLNQPEHRLLAITASKKRPSLGVEADLFDLIRNKAKNTLDEVRRAHEIHSREHKREVIEAFLLVGITSGEIESILKVPVVVSETYAYLFFDPTVFEDELDRIDYAYTYTKSTWGRELKTFAIELGQTSLKIRLSRGTYDPNAQEVHKGVRSTAYMLAQQARVNPTDSSLARAAQQWAKIALKAAIEGDTKDAAALDQIRIALEAHDDTTSEEESGISREEILH